MSNEQKLREALQAGLHYAQEALDSHDIANQLHPSTEPERNAILEDIRVITEALATTEQAEPAVQWKVYESKHLRSIVVTEPNGMEHEIMSDDIVHPRAQRLFNRLLEGLNSKTTPAPSQPAVPQGFTFEQLADACAEAGVSDSKFEAIVLSLKTTTAAPSQEPVTLTEREVGDCIDKTNRESRYGKHHFGWLLDFSSNIIAALREKEVRK